MITSVRGDVRDPGHELLNSNRTRSVAVSSSAFHAACRANQIGANAKWIQSPV